MPDSSGQCVTGSPVGGGRVGEAWAEFGSSCPIGEQLQRKKLNLSATSSLSRTPPICGQTVFVLPQSYSELESVKLPLSDVMGGH